MTFRDFALKTAPRSWSPPPREKPIPTQSFHPSGFHIGQRVYYNSSFGMGFRVYTVIDQIVANPYGGWNVWGVWDGSSRSDRGFMPHDQVHAE